MAFCAVAGVRGRNAAHPRCQSRADGAFAGANRIALRRTRRSARPALIALNAAQDGDFVTDSEVERAGEQAMTGEEAIAANYRSHGPAGEIVSGEGGLDSLFLKHMPSGQSVTVYLFGATLQSWKVGPHECFFTSKEAKFDRSKAIRAGIPIVFPQFGDMGPLPPHGFARVTDWEVKSIETLEDGSSHAVLSISSDTDSELIRQWSQGRKWEADFSVTLSYSGLETQLRVRNLGSEPIEFTAAFHNYFKITEVNAVRVYGLDKTQYTNRLDGSVHDAPDDLGYGVSITDETDRIYGPLVDDLAVFDMTSLRLYKIKKTDTLPDATLWSPFGTEGSDPNWNDFVCVEPATVNKPATVQPGEEWVGAQLIEVEI